MPEKKITHEYKTTRLSNIFNSGLSGNELINQIKIFDQNLKPYKYDRSDLEAALKKSGMLIADFKEAKVDRVVSLDPWKKKNPNMSHALDCFRYFIYGNFLEITSTYNLDKFDARKMQL